MICPICCKSTDQNFIEKIGEYELYHCISCDVVFSNPMRNPGEEWYKKIYILRNHGVETKLSWSHKQFLKYKPIPGGRLIDIGCGDGFFLYEAKKIGYKVTGIDFDKEAIEKGKKLYGLSELYSDNLENFLLNCSGKFDIITLFDVLEHSENPVKLIEDINKILKLNGVIIISLPNRDRWPKSTIPKKLDSPPHHLTRWNISAVTKFLENHGFQIKKVVFSRSYTYNILFSIGFGITNRLVKKALNLKSSPGEENKSSEVILRRATIWAEFRRTLFDKICFFIDIFLKIIGVKGSYIYLIAKKRS